MDIYVKIGEIPLWILIGKIFLIEGVNQLFIYLLLFII